MSPHHADVVICGAGIAGLAAAYQLSTHHGVRRVLLVDERAPMSLTSDKSTECYRNWWPGPDDGMVWLMNRSIDLLEKLALEHDNCFHLSRRGYLYATMDEAGLDRFVAAAAEPASLGAGELRTHRGGPGAPAYVPASADGFEGAPGGADLILDRALIRAHFPYLSDRVVALLHARRAGWFSGQQLGMLLLREARARGVTFLSGRVEAVETCGGRVAAVRVATSAGSERVATRRFVNAAGPFVGEVAAMVGAKLPVFAELHLKVNFPDHRRVVPRDAPMLIHADPQRLPWDEEARALLESSDETRWMVGPLAAGAHLRPDGGASSPYLLLLWPQHTDPAPPHFPLPDDPTYAEITLRGLCALVPALAAYLERMPRPVVDGGYYMRTEENRPLIGPLPVEGAFLIGALSGYGLMAALAAAELLAAHVTGASLPERAGRFTLTRYADPDYQRLLARWGESGQL